MVEISKIVEQFENKTLPKEQWTHNAHFAVAFVYLDKYKTILDTLPHVRESIKAYNVAVGTENTENSGYHETLTVFWLTVVFEYERLKKSIDVHTTYSEFIETSYANAAFPLEFYSKATLFSTAARQEWMAPDLMPLTELNKIFLK